MSGREKYCISMSLYQRSPVLPDKYMLPLEYNLSNWKFVYPPSSFDWYVYYDDTVDNDLLVQCKNTGWNLIHETPNINTSGMLWRLKSMFDNRYDAFKVHECDERCSHKQRYYFENFLRSGKIAGTIMWSELSYHNTRFVGSQVFVRPKLIQEHKHLLKSLEHLQNTNISYTGDELWLSEVFYPCISHSYDYRNRIPSLDHAPPSHVSITTSRKL